MAFAVDLLAVGPLSRYAPVPSIAAQSPAEPDAHVLFARSREAYRAGRFADAAALHREAYRLKPDPVLLYNLGRACEKLEDSRCAVDAYTKYLESATDVPDRESIKVRLSELQSK